MRPTLISLLATLCLALVACEEPWFRFVAPSDGSLVPSGSPSFEMRVPLGTLATDVELFLDGAPLAGVPVQIAGAVLTGALSGVAPGAHTLKAEMDVASPFGGTRTVESERSFEAAAAPGFAVNESVEQLQITGAPPEMQLTLYDARSRVVATAEADEQGSLIFRELEPGTGYTVAAATAPLQMAGPFEVMSVEGSLPPQSFYADQVIEEGYGYLTTRDGTQLSIFVTLPGPIEDGPYPTVINASGYSPSEPGGPLFPPDTQFGGLLETLCDFDPGKDPLDILCEAAPNHPSGLVAGILGYATVGVNLRGTGCSGGAYDFFDTLQVLDGYDVVETVAAQPWARGKVGLVGLSFPGITSLFFARTQPPSLAAIAPLSVIANTVYSTLAPGGIYNNGFAQEWGQQVVNRAGPFGDRWVEDLAAAGDSVCADNQLLHSQKVDIIAKARSDVFYPPELADPISPELFADRITVPVFTTGSWQDEQTGGHFPSMWDDYVNAPLVRFQAFNGAHADGFAPHTLVEWKLFLDFYVAQERLPLSRAIPTIAPLLFEEIFGGSTPLPTARISEFEAYPSFADALEAYEAEDPVRILFESGGTSARPGQPVQTFEARFPSWPPPQTQARRFYLHADGSLRDFTPSDTASASVFQHDATKGQETLFDLTGGTAPASFFWNSWQAGRQAVFASEPLAETLTLLGHASADLWLKGGVPEAEIEVMLSEVRPDGQEVYVQSGWLRATQRALAPEATELRPVQYRLEADAMPLPTDGFELARVEIFPFAHVFRAGSRIRMSVASPGGNRARWRFELTEYPFAVEHAVAHSVEHPSSLVLPVIPDLTPPAGLPPCALRAQPCRTYVPHTNTLE